jgi:hypothetical protein
VTDAYTLSRELFNKRADYRQDRPEGEEGGKKGKYSRRRAARHLGSEVAPFQWTVFGLAG